MTERFLKQMSNNKRRNLNPMTSELPSMKFMGSEVKVRKAFPYHPMQDLYECHLEKGFSDYKRFALDKRIPSLEDIQRRYWRKRLILFLRKKYAILGLEVPPMNRNESEFWAANPLFKEAWIEQKAKHLTVNANKFRFGNKRHAFAHYLQYKWMADKKYEYLQRTTGLREEPYWRQYTRSKCLNNYQNLIIWCRHWDCWRIRFRNLPLIPFMWFKFWFYWRQNPDLLDIH